MQKNIRVVIAQLNLIAGDIQGNLKKHLHAVNTARDELAGDMIVFPELSLTGYPPEDLLLRESFISDAHAALMQFCHEAKGIHCVVGHPHASAGQVFNSCSLIHAGKILGRYDKQRLPNYGVFDECRYFTPGTHTCVLPVHHLPIGLIICEDLWRLGPAHATVTQGARIIIIPNASPFESDKHEQRLSVLAKRAVQDEVPIVYVNQVCGQDELIFDGGSMVVDAQGQIAHFAGFFEENLLPVDFSIHDNFITTTPTPFIVPKIEDRIYQALVLGLRDYIEKNNFPGAIVGLSGGIDSALTLTIAVDAIGKDKVRAIMMPSRYTADMSNEDAAALAENLGVETETISIEPVYKNFLESLAPSFAGKKTDITEENIQARCRAIILMALSNKYGHIVLTTGNRSEIAVGYCTLYGDMAGGYAPLKDVPKTLVYQLANYRNQISAVIPQRTIERPPTAELAPDQKDEDSLPPYSILDRILECYLNECLGIEEIIARGFDRNTVIRIAGLIRRSEYKRKQSALGPRINHKSFGKDWRYPVTNGFKG
jgi:NAD+ synthase (glutamine-hydrolysing)